MSGKKTIADYNNDFDQALSTSIERFTCPGEVIFSKIAGSHSHNTALPTSDVDVLGVYVAPTYRFLGMHPPADTFTSSDNDITIHEVGKFCSLLLKGNPQVTEMLFTDSLCSMNDEWRCLTAHRKSFLSKRVVKQYLGFINNQVHRYSSDQSVHSKGGEPTEKYLYHICRLSLDAQRIVNGEFPLVWKEGEERDQLMEIRNGNCKEADVIKGVSILADRIHKALATTSLPDEGDAGFLEKWLMGLRKRRFQ